MLETITSESATSTESKIRYGTPKTTGGNVSIETPFQPVNSGNITDSPDAHRQITPGAYQKTYYRVDVDYIKDQAQKQQLDLKQVARELCISMPSLSRRLNDVADFSGNELGMLATILDCRPDMLFKPTEKPLLARRRANINGPNEKIRNQRRINNNRKSQRLNRNNN